MDSSLTLPSAAARAHALSARRSTLPTDGAPSEVILESWARSVSAGIDCRARTAISVVDGADLARRRERVAVARRLAQAELETLAPQIAGSNFLLAFADHEGVILDLYADNRFATSGAAAGILSGSRWNEALCGTNGLGTALASGRAVAVTGLEHYLLQLRDISCTAAPVRDASGAIVGVLDASSYVESRQRHTLALVQMAATHIENGLLMAQMGQHLVLALHPRLEFLGTLGAGLIAFDDEGRLLALNQRCTQLLQGLPVGPGTPYEDLFGMPFEQMLAQIQRGGELRLRDVLGSTLLARCVNRPRPRQAASAASSGSASAAGDTDPVLASAYAHVQRAMRLKAPVLICGEAASGKTTLARYAHAAGGRRGALVTIPCGDLMTAALETEFFGVDGAAVGGRSVPIADADGGTVVFDAVDRLAPGLQSALLRFLDDRLVRTAGSTSAKRLDVQVLATTTADLDEAVATGHFRGDLLDSLGTVRVALPPLRARHDFARLVQGALAALDPGVTISDDAVECLQHHGWAGNFRELRTVLTRALLGLEGPVLGREAIVPHLVSRDAPTPSSLRRASTDMVRRELARCGGNVSQTARVLGISRTTVYRHLAQGE